MKTLITPPAEETNQEITVKIDRKCMIPKKKIMIQTIFNNRDHINNHNNNL